MDGEKCCENCDKCMCCHGGHMGMMGMGMGMMMECCKEHGMSKEHLEMKKKMLEEKLKWVTQELEKKDK